MLLSTRPVHAGGKPEVGFKHQKSKDQSYHMTHTGHECNSTNAQHLVRCIPEELKQDIEYLVKCRATTGCIRHYLNIKHPQNKITARDVQNFVQKCRGPGGADAQNLVQSLIDQQKRDPMMTVKTKQDVNGALQV